MKVSKKFLGSIIVGIISFNILATTSSAETTTATSGTHTFTKSWSATVKNSAGQGTLDYGFNTALINEDYAHGYHNTLDHYSSLKNKNGNYSSMNRGPLVCAKVEKNMQEVLYNIGIIIKSIL